MQNDHFTLLAARHPTRSVWRFWLGIEPEDPSEDRVYGPLTDHEVIAKLLDENLQLDWCGVQLQAAIQTATDIYNLQDHYDTHPHPTAQEWINSLAEVPDPSTGDA